MVIWSLCFSQLHDSIVYIFGNIVKIRFNFVSSRSHEPNEQNPIQAAYWLLWQIGKPETWEVCRQLAVPINYVNKAKWSNFCPFEKPPFFVWIYKPYLVLTMHDPAWKGCLKMIKIAASELLSCHSICPSRWRKTKSVVFSINSC
jgi:hypothetical protein